MPADLELNANGTAKMAFVGATPWHTLGNKVDESLGRDIPAFLKAANMDTDHELVQLVTKSTDYAPVQAALLQLANENDITVLKTKIAELATQNVGGQEVARYGVRRVQDGKIVGNVGPRYTVLQNREAFEWFKPFLDLDEARLHTAGVLAEGAKIWVLAKLNKEPLEIAAGDTVDKYLLLSHAHDGSMAVRAGFSPIRVVCSNTLAMAHRDKASKLIRVKHSKNVKTNLEHIRETMNLINQEFEATAEQYRRLATKSISQDDLKKYVKLVFAFKQPALAEVTDTQIAWGKEEHDAEAISTRMKHTLEEVLALTETGKGNDLASIRGTFWQGYNAVTEYLSYNSGNSDDNRMDSLWFGAGADLNAHALSLALQMSA